jgi:hypothetical protein
MLSYPATVSTLIGTLEPAGITTAFDVAAVLVPAALYAVTENEFVDPGVRPTTVHVSPAVEHVPPREPLTLYPSIPAPPLLTGACQLTTAEVSFLTATTETGAPGALPNVAVTGAEALPAPREFDARTTNVCVAPKANASTMQLVPEVKHPVVPFAVTS